MNRVILSGNVGNDCVLETKGDRKFTRFGLAVQREYDNQITDWVNCVVFGNFAEKFVVPYVKRGSRVVITGSFETNDVEKEDGTKIRYYTIIVNHLELFSNNSETSEEEQGNSVVEESNGLPF